MSIRDADLEVEQSAQEALPGALDAFLDAVGPLWRWGDGDGGHIISKLYERATERGIRR